MFQPKMFRKKTSKKNYDKKNSEINFNKNSNKKFPKKSVPPKKIPKNLKNIFKKKWGRRAQLFAAEGFSSPQARKKPPVGIKK